MIRMKTFRSDIGGSNAISTKETKTTIHQSMVPNVSVVSVRSTLRMG